MIKNQLWDTFSCSLNIAYIQYASTCIHLSQYYVTVIYIQSSTSNTLVLYGIDSIVSKWERLSVFLKLSVECMDSNFDLFHCLKWHYFPQPECVWFFFFHFSILSLKSHSNTLLRHPKIAIWGNRSRVSSNISNVGSKTSNIPPSSGMSEHTVGVKSAGVWKRLSHISEVWIHLQ